MKASETNFLNFLRKTTQFIIPIYQRTYSWHLEQCEQIWKKILMRLVKMKIYLLIL